MNLTATAHSLELVTSNATLVHWDVDYTVIDKTGATAATPASNQNSVSSAMDTVIVSAPAANVYRVVTSVSIRNAGAASIDVTIQKAVSGTEYEIHKATLLVGQKLGYTRETGWDVYNADGKRQGDGADGADGAAGAPGVGTSGTTTVDFGGWPGKCDTFVDITGQAGIVSGSVVEAWLSNLDSADHTADEHRIEPIKVRAAEITAGVGFRVYATVDHNKNSPKTPMLYPERPGGASRAPSVDSKSGKGRRAYGTWNIFWRWS